MIAFEVRLNGQLLYTAGHVDIAVHSAIVHYLSKKQDLFMTVGGLTDNTQGPSQYLTWSENSQLSLGDEVSIKIVDVPTCDAPTGVRVKP